MRSRAARISRPAAALLAVATAAMVGAALWKDDLLVALALAPLVVASLLVLAGRTLGVFLLVTASVIAGLVVVGASLPPAELPPTGVLCLWCATGALGLFVLFAPRLVGRDPPAAALGVVLAIVLGLAVTIVAAVPADDLQERYWTWQGEREARHDSLRHRLRLKSFGMGGGPYAGCEEALRPFDVEVEHVAECVLPAKEGAQWLGYNQAARDILMTRHGAAFFTSLGCGLQRLPPEEPSS
jgi:hypothetical protein